LKKTLFLEKKFNQDLNFFYGSIRIPRMSQIKNQPGTTGTFSRARWLMIGLGFIITLINYLDRTALAYAITPICEELKLNHATFGMILSAFGIGYMIMTLGGGILVDKWGARSVWSGAAVFWSACIILMGMATNFGMFFALRSILGIAEGPHFPALTRVVADWLPKGERATATAIGLSAVPMASVIGAPLITNMIIYLGWRTMFIIMGSLGVVWAIIWWFIYRDFPEHSKMVDDKELSHIREGKPVDRNHPPHTLKSHDLQFGKTTWKFLLTDPSLCANNFAFFAFGYLLFFATLWLPGYFESTYHVKLKEIGIYLIAPWLTSAVLLFMAGRLSDYIWQKTGSLRKARTHMIWICQLISGLCFIPLMFNPSLEQALLFISLGLGFGMMPNSCFYALNTDLAKDKAATSLGLMDSYLALAGILAPSITGQVSQITGNFSAAFGILIVLTLLAVVAVLIFQKPDQGKAIKPIA
jgi:ACS family hexuronate transporter-like MFS transporter